MEDITLEKITDKRKHWIDYYQSLHDQQKEDDNYYELTYDANIPTKLGYEQKTPSTARDWVDFGIMNYTLDNPKVFVPPLNYSDVARSQSEMLEDFYNYWVRQMVLQIKEIAKQELKCGEGFLKLIVDDTYYGAKTTDLSKEELTKLNEERGLLFPLQMQCPNPINVLASPAHRGLVPVEVIEYYKMTVAEIEEICDRNGWEWNSGGKKSTDTVDWTAYYSADKRCFLIGDDPVLTPEVQPNYLGFCPYVHIPAGFGSSNYEGKPEYKYRSIFHGKKDMIKLQTRVLSQLDAITAKYAWPWFELKGEPDYIQKYFGKNFSINPNEPLVIPKDVEIIMHQGEQPPAALFQHAAIVSSLAEPPSILGGQRPSGIYSGYGEVALLTTAKPIYKDAFKNLEDGLAVFLGMGARVVEKVLGYKLAIRGTTSSQEKYIDPEKIKGYYDCEVHLLAEPPEAADMRKTLGTNLYKNDVISLRTCLIDYHDMTGEEADDEMSQILAEKALQHPAIQQQMGEDAIDRLGMERAKQIIEEAKLQATKGATGTPTGTPVTTGAASVPRYQRIMPGMEGATMPQEAEIGQIPITGVGAGR